MGRRTQRESIVVFFKADERPRSRLLVESRETR